MLLELAMLSFFFVLVMEFYFIFDGLWEALIL